MNGASDKLPRLVADLVLATSRVPDVIRFLSDGAGRVRGFDGVLLSAGGPPHVPAGKSYWEFGCEKDIATKAKKDVASRTKLVDDPAERAASTLVLVTPLHYDNPKKPLPKFVAELAKGCGWKEIRLYDGADLRQWLSLAPAVAARWARLEMQTMPPGVLSTEEFWQEYSSRFDPLLREEVLLAGRQRQTDELIDRLAKLLPDRISVFADSHDEAVAYAVAAIRKSDPATRLVLEARTLIVNTTQAAQDLRDKKLVFLPMRAALETAGLLIQQGPTVLPLGRREASNGGLRLSRPPHHEFAEALGTMSFPRTRAMQLASECGRSVTILARRIPGTGAPRPLWSTSSALVPALVAGGWDSANKHDMAMMVRLAGATDYNDWQATMQPFLVEDDPALEHEGTVWKVRAPVDAFVTLGAYIGSNEFDRLRAVAHEVFADRDANAGKTSAELFMAPPGIKHSSWLRIGLATTLLLTATLADAAEIGPALAPSGGPERWVDDVVAGIPGLMSDISLLSSLSEALPILAEAAPRPFVKALDRLVRTAPEAVSSLFVERVVFISPESDHVWLLWALETLAWDGALLPQICVLLTHLAALDPGGKLGNRPSKTLRQLLLPWLPHTNATLQSRLGAFRAVIRTDEAVGWELALQLLPEHHAISDMTYRPLIRDAGRYDQGVPHAERVATQVAASAEVTRLVGVDLNRWATLIEHIPNLSSDDQATVTARLNDLLASLPQHAREELWRETRNLVVRHSGFPDADWTMKGEPLAALTQVVSRWTPNDAITAAALLFDEAGFAYGALNDPPETQRDRERIGEAALRRVLDEEGHSGVLRLAEVTRSSWIVGRHVAALLTAEESMALCGEALEHRSPKLAELAIAISGRSAMLDQQQWTKLLEAEHLSGRAPADTASLLLGLSDGPQTWDLAQHLGSDVDEAYWKAKQSWRLEGGDTAVLERAVRKLIQVGRASASLTLLENAEAPSPALVFETLDRTVSELNSGAMENSSMFAHYVERVFDRLRARVDVDKKELARREFAFLPLLTGPGRPRRDLAIFNLMASDPTDFIAFLAIVYRSSSAPADDDQEVDKGRWRAAYSVIEAFRTVPGEANGEVNGRVLSGWVSQALQQATGAGLADIGAQCIGRVLAHAPVDKGDGAWPAIALRDLIEDVAADDLEAGILMERFSMRGVYSKGIYDGGNDEREFARVTRVWAEACAAWPRTAAMLLRFAEDWDRQAKREDSEAKQRLMRD